MRGRGWQEIAAYLQQLNVYLKIEICKVDKFKYLGKFSSV